MKPEHCNIPDHIRKLKEPESEGFDGDEIEREENFLSDSDQNDDRLDDRTNIINEEDI